MSKKILFFGNERLATGVTTTAPALQALIRAGYEIGAVVVAQNEIGKSRKARELEVASVAQKHSIPLIAPDNLTLAAGQLASFGAEAAVLIAYGKIVPLIAIDLFPRGIINVHPSLLPLNRGSTPLESVILSGASETGVSLMAVSSKMDTGPIYAQQALPLEGNETKQNLANHLSTLGATMVIQYLPAILDGSLASIAQDDKLATYGQHITRSESELDFAKTAEQLEREVRAYAGWPRSRTTIGNTSVIVTKAHIAHGDDESGKLWLESKQLGIYTSRDILVIDNLIPNGKAEMATADFLAGYKVL